MNRAANRLLSLLALVPLACSSTTAAPVITAFAASPATVGPGQSATLSWTVSGASTLSIDQGVGVVTGPSVLVSPAQTLRYTLTASNGGGVSQISASPTADTTYTLTARDANGIATVTSVTVSVHAAGPGIYYTDPPAALTSARQISLVRNSASTPAARSST